MFLNSFVWLKEIYVQVRQLTFQYILLKQVLNWFLRFQQSFHIFELLVICNFHERFDSKSSKVRAIHQFLKFLHSSHLSTQHHFNQDKKANSLQICVMIENMCYFQSISLGRVSWLFLSLGLKQWLDFYSRHPYQSYHLR